MNTKFTGLEQKLGKSVSPEKEKQEFENSSCLKACSVKRRGSVQPKHILL